MNENNLGIHLAEKSLVSAMLEKLYGLKKHFMLLWREKGCGSLRRILQESFKAVISPHISHLSISLC